MRDERIEIRARVPSGTPDAELFRGFSDGSIPFGTKLEITSKKILPQDGKGAEVVLLHSATHYTGSEPSIEHLVSSNDPRVDDMRVRGLLSWKIIGKVSEDELDRITSDIAENQNPGLIIRD